MTGTATSPRPTAPGTARWQALHAYVHADRDAMDRLVVEHVAPAVHELVERGQATSWFFVRYWEGGPHVRVRLRDPAPGALDGLAQRLRDALGSYPALDTFEPASFYAALGVGPEQARAMPWEPHGTVVPRAYEPETGRYGGSEALAVAEDLFRTSSEVAVAAVAAAPGESRRLALAMDLLLGWVRALGLDDAGAVRWLRWYTYGWKYASEGGPTDEGAVRLAAEAEFDRNEQRWLERARRVAGAAAEGRAGGLHQAWWSGTARAHDALSELDQRERLTNPPEMVAASQLHMLHNRLGLAISDELYLAWLASLAVATGRERDGFFDDGAASADRVYLEHSKFVPARFARDGLGERAAARREVWETGPAVALPPPPPPGALDVPLGVALAGRRSRLGRFTGTMALGELAALLGHAAGVRGTQAVATPGGDWQHPKLPYPSAGASYGVFVRLVAQDVTGLERGLYELDPHAPALRPAGPAPGARTVERSSPYLERGDGNDPLIDVSAAPALLLVCGDLALVRPRYGLRALRFLLLEAGHAAQNLVLVAGALGWDSTTIGGLYDDGAHQLAQLDGYTELAIYLVPLGRPQTG